MKTLIWLDDARDPFDQKIDWLVFSPIGRNINLIWLKSYEEFVNWINLNGLPTAICFDHDLGFENNMPELNGYDCAKFLVNYCLDGNFSLPLYSIQSANPVGRMNIESLLENFKKLQK